MSASLQARDLRFAYADHLVLDGVSLTVGPRSRIGIVGPNGAGKSTLLQALAGAAAPERGTITIVPPTATVGYLPQEPDRRHDETLRAFLHRRTGVAASDEAMHVATAAMAELEPDAADAYSAALERWLALGGPDLDARATTVWADLGMPVALLDQPTASLSGGEAARGSLAAILLSRFDVFLLDEPTNDLDFDGLARLERFLDELDGGVVVVSHDRAFLDRVVTTVVELDEVSHRATEYGGGWQAYLDARAVARRHAEEAYEGYRGEREALSSRAQRQREWATQGLSRAKKKPADNDKNIKAFKIAQTEKLAAKARATERAAERLEVVDKPWEGWELHLKLAAAPRSGAVVVRLDRAVVERGTFRLGPIDVEIGWAERVALLGPNGSGKSTLLAALLGRIPLAAGERWMGPSVVVGELDQARARFSGESNLLEAFVDASGLLPQETRSLLAKFGLSATDVARPSGALSPGERTRAELALLMARQVNLLVLDEPTNHLDLPAIEQLEQALDTWTGTLILVTHDRRLLDAVRIDRTINLGMR